MTAWRLTAGLQNLRAQVNRRWPDRDHASDGSIGDAAHMREASGHNPDDTPGSRPEYDDRDGVPEVRAWDMDVDFREPGMNGQILVDHIRRLTGVASVIRYMIYNRRMYHVRDGFQPIPYVGLSPHVEHIHFSGARSQAGDNNTTFDYRLWEVNMPTADEIAKAVWDVAWGKDDRRRTAAQLIQESRTAAQTAASALHVLTAAGSTVDVEALAGALAPSLAAAIVNRLPDAGLTEDQIENAVRNVLRVGVDR
jgi:hypothetical protein